MFPWASEKFMCVTPELCAVIIHFRKVLGVYFEHGRHCGWLGELWPSWGLHVISGKAAVDKLLPFLSPCQNTRLDWQIAFPTCLSAGRWEKAVRILSVGRWERIGKLDTFLLLERELNWEHQHPGPVFLLGALAASWEAGRQWTTWWLAS